MMGILPETCKQYNVDTLHLSVYIFMPHIMIAVRSAVVVHNNTVT
jgi:hypothetical protein